MRGSFAKAWRCAIPLLLSASILFAQSGTPVGSVISTRSAQIGNVFAAVGTTVFSGDRIVTNTDSGLIIQAGSFQLSFQDNSSAILYSDKGGLNLILEKGSFTFSSPQTAAPLTIFASDVRILAESRPDLFGYVTVVDSCAIDVTNQRGLVTTIRGTDRLTVPEMSSRRITPSFPVEPRPMNVSASEKTLHAGHSHGPCKPPAGATNAKGPSWLLPVLFVEAGVVTSVVLARPVSPH